MFFLGGDVNGLISRSSRLKSEKYKYVSLRILWKKIANFTEYIEKEN